MKLKTQRLLLRVVRLVVLIAGVLLLLYGLYLWLEKKEEALSALPFGAAVACFIAWSTVLRHKRPLVARRPVRHECGCTEVCSPVAAPGAGLWDSHCKRLPYERTAEHHLAEENPNPSLARTIPLVNVANFTNRP